MKMQFKSETISLMNMQIPSCVNQQPMYTFCGLIHSLVCCWANHSNLMCYFGQVFDSEIKNLLVDQNTL